MTFDKERLEEIAHDPKGSGLEMDLAKALLVANLQLDEAMKAIRAIAPYCKVKYGMDEEAVSAIERFAYAEKRNDTRCTCGALPSGAAHNPDCPTKYDIHPT